MALNKNAKKWIKALRSRKFKQTTGRLRGLTRFCCLGVACELAAKAGIISFYDDSCYDGESGSLPVKVREWLGLRTSDGDFFTKKGEGIDLTILNDVEKKTFGQIARIIESEPRGLFV